MAHSSLEAARLPKTRHAKSPRSSNKACNLHRVVYYDADDGTILIRQKKKVDKEDKKLKRFPLKRGKKEVSLWVDSETETTLKDDKEKQDSDIFLAMLRLDNLGIMDKLYSELGLLSWLYVSASWNDAS